IDVYVYVEGGYPAYHFEKASLTRTPSMCMYMWRGAIQRTTSR
mgnify:CR=1